MSGSIIHNLDQNTVGIWADIIANFIIENEIVDLDEYLVESGMNEKKVWSRLSILIFWEHSAALEQQIKVSWFADKFDLQERVKEKIFNLGMDKGKFEFFYIYKINIILFKVIQEIL